MKAIQADLNRSIDYFIAEITELARRAAIDTLETTLHGPAADPAYVEFVTVQGRGTKKRPPAELDEVAQRFLRFVAQHPPGLRVEQINKELRTRTKIHHCQSASSSQRERC